MKKLFDTRRPLGRLCYLLGALLLAFSATQLEAQAPQTTQIADVVYKPDGTPANGTLLISWPSFSTAEGRAVVAGSMSVPLGSGGQLSVALAPNVGADPAGTAYSVVYRLEGMAPSQEYWSVPTQGPTTIAAIRSKVVPQNVALQIVSRQYVDDQLALKAADAVVLHKSGDESVSGVKTFSLSPLVPTPSAAGQVANMSYVDAAVAGINLAGYLAKAGGTMTGPLLLAGTPSQPAEASNKSYVDSSIAGINLSGYLAKAGGTMTGPLVLSGSPAQPGEAANRSYVDAAVAGINLSSYLAKAGGTMTGPLVLAGAPSQAAEAATKEYVDTHAGGGGTSAFVVASTQAGATADAKISAAHTALPASGGTIWVDLTGNQTLAADPFAGMTKPAHVIFNAGTYTANVDLHVPRSVTLEFKAGAVLSVASAKTATIDGPILAPQTRIFAGAGKVELSGVPVIPVEWFGGRNDVLLMQNCSMTAGSPVLGGCAAYLGPGFTAADVGKIVLFHDYRTSAYPGISHATIVGYTNSSTVTLDTNATSSATGVITYYGTDALPAAQAMLASKTGHYVFTKNSAHSEASSSGVSPDYVFSGALVVNTSPACYNSLWLDGSVPSGGWEGATMLVFPADSGGIKLGPNCFQAKISNLHLKGLAGNYGDNLGSATLFHTDLTADGAHGIVLAGGEPSVENVWVEQFAGHGIYLDGNGAVFGGVSQPDLWKLYNVGVAYNRAYGIFVAGSDANAGVATMVNSRGNQLGGIYDYSVLGNTWVSASSHTDARATPFTRGASNTLSSCTVTSNVMTCTTSSAHGFVKNQWIYSTGETDASFDTTCITTSIPSTTTYTCNFVHANGSTTGGTAATAKGADIEAKMAAIAGPTPIHFASFVGKGGSSTSTWVKPYCELLGEAAPDFNGSALVLNGNCVGPTNTGGSINYGGLGVASGAMTAFVQSGFRVWQPNGATAHLDLKTGQNSDSLAPGFQDVNAMQLRFLRYDDVTLYQLQATGGAQESFFLRNAIHGSGISDAGGAWDYTSATGLPIRFQRYAGGDVEFYCGGATFCGQFLTSGVFKASTPDFSDASATRPVKSGTSAAAPASCVANKDLYIKTDATAGQQLFLCNATGNGWNLLGDGGGAGAVSSFNGRTGAVLPQAGDYASVTETLTNKTIDAEATGNSITLPFYAQFAAAGCNNATASPLLDLSTANAPSASCLTGSNTQQGTLDFDDASGKSAQVSFLLPPDWSGAVDADLYWLVTTGGSSNAVKWTIATACSASGATYDTAFNAAQTITTNVGSNNALTVSSQAGLTTTGCTPDNWLHIKIARDVTDTSTATARLVSVRFRFRRTM